MTDAVGAATVRLVEQAVAVLAQLETLTQRRSPLLAGMQELQAQWADPCPQVALVGASSAGKTSLLRLLLGVDFLPVGRTTTTAVLTALRHGPAPVGEVQLRDVVQVTPPPGSGQLEAASLLAMRAWATEPGYGIQEVAEIAGGRRVLLSQPQLVERLDAPLASGACFEVSFTPLASVRFDLSDPQSAGRFGAFLQDPRLTLRVAKAVCHLPHDRLRQMSLIDTAGYSSPTFAHAQVSDSLLARRPDRILLLLDARKLDSVASHDAVASLRSIVQEPDDYHDLFVGLTHWDRALISHIDDRDLDEDYADQADRISLTDSFLTEKRAELAAMLLDQLGVAPRTPVRVFPLALAEKAPADLARHLGELWAAIEQPDESRAWRLWSVRRRAAAAMFQTLRAECRLALDEARRQAAGVAATGDQLTQRLQGNIQRYRNISVAADRVIHAVRSSVLAQRDRLQGEIGQLAGAKQIRKFIQDGYAGQLKSSIDAIWHAVDAQFEQLAALLPADTLTRPAVLHPDFVTPDPALASRFGSRVQGRRYLLRKGFSLALGSLGPMDLTGRDIKHARLALQHHAAWAIDSIGLHLEHWVGHVDDVRRVTVQMLGLEYQQLAQDDSVTRASMRDSAARIEPLTGLVAQADLMVHELRS